MPKGKKMARAFNLLPQRMRSAVEATRKEPKPRVAGTPRAMKPRAPGQQQNGQAKPLAKKKKTLNW